MQHDMFLWLGLDKWEEEMGLALFKYEMNESSQGG